MKELKKISMLNEKIALDVRSMKSLNNLLPNDWKDINTNKQPSLIKPILEGIAFSSVVIMCVVIYFVLAAR